MYVQGIKRGHPKVLQLNIKSPVIGITEDTYNTQSHSKHVQKLQHFLYASVYDWPTARPDTADCFNIPGKTSPYVWQLGSQSCNLLQIHVSGSAPRGHALATRLATVEGQLGPPELFQQPYAT